MTEQVVIAAFYHFVALPDYADMKRPLLAHCQKHDLKGSILLAAEGINGTMAGTRAGIDSLLVYLHADPRLQSLTHKESYADFIPFQRLKVRLKKEIVSLQVPAVDPTTGVGTYVAPEAWNDLLADPEVLVIDTRNDFEVKLGTFRGAINPQTAAFSDFPHFVETQLDPAQHKKVAMFCTGGIRCEKATAYMLQQGFAEVYHLQGGILQYLADVPTAASLWQGECFVFDERVTVNHDLTPGTYQLCAVCQMPLTADDTNRPEYDAGVACHHCYAQLDAERLARLRERQRQLNEASTDR
jgi:UPF0176 protein